jgi:hypothetical protein
VPGVDAVPSSSPSGSAACLSYGIAHCPHLRACSYSSYGCGATCCFQRSWYGPRRNFR